MAEFRSDTSSRPPPKRTLLESLIKRPDRTGSVWIRPDISSISLSGSLIRPSKLMRISDKGGRSPLVSSSFRSFSFTESLHSCLWNPRIIKPNRSKCQIWPMLSIIHLFPYPSSLYRPFPGRDVRSIQDFFSINLCWPDSDSTPTMTDKRTCKGWKLNPL